MKKWRLVLAIAMAVSIQACAGSVASIVKESEKDPDFGFDGVYDMVVDHPGGRQEMGSGWFTDCSPQSFKAQIRVANSEVKMRWRDDLTLEGFVNQAGKFRLEKQLAEDGVKGRGTTLSDGTVTIILQGHIQDDVMKGVLEYGIAQFANRGCTYPVAYSSR